MPPKHDPARAAAALRAKLAAAPRSVTDAMVAAQLAGAPLERGAAVVVADFFAGLAAAGRAPEHAATEDGLQQSVDVTVDAEGRPVRVVFARRSDANPEKTYRLQPFGGFLSEFRDFGGFRLPTHVEAGNQFGTAAFFPFFIADVSEITFPSQPASRP